VKRSSRAPLQPVIQERQKYYIIKWLTDYIADYGIDGYRGDTVKHTDETFGQI
jgi:glycosidase